MYLRGSTRDFFVSVHFSLTLPVYTGFCFVLLVGVAE